MTKNYEYKNIVEIIRQADAFIIDGKLTSAVIEEKSVGVILDKKVLELFWSTGWASNILYLHEDYTYKFDGQTIEVIDNELYRHTIIPMLKLKKWEDY